MILLSHVKNIGSEILDFLCIKMWEAFCFLSFFCHALSTEFLNSNFTFWPFVIKILNSKCKHEIKSEWLLRCYYYMFCWIEIKISKVYQMILYRKAYWEGILEFKRVNIKVQLYYQSHSLNYVNVQKLDSLNENVTSQWFFHFIPYEFTVNK